MKLCIYVVISLVFFSNTCPTSQFAYCYKSVASACNNRSTQIIPLRKRSYSNLDNNKMSFQACYLENRLDNDENEIVRLKYQIWRKYVFDKYQSKK